MMLTEIDKARDRSIVYHALSLGFGVPKGEVQKYLVEPEGRRRLATVLDALGIAGELDFRTGQRALLERYEQLLGPRGRISPYEADYQPPGGYAEDRLLAELEAFIGALELTTGGATRSDHVSSECEVMAILNRKEMNAIETGTIAALESIRRAKADFFLSHLIRFAPALGGRLERIDGDDFYGALGRLLKRFIETDYVGLSVS